MTSRRALVIVASLVLFAACLSGDDAPTASPTPTQVQSYPAYASQYCAAQVTALETGHATLDNATDGLASDSFETRLAAFRTVVDELSTEQAVLLAHLESVSPPETDDLFIERRRVSERDLFEVMAEVAALMPDVTDQAELDAALEMLTVAFYDLGVELGDALEDASPELNAALRAHPACAPLFEPLG